MLYLPNIRFGEVDFSGDKSYIWGSGQYSAPRRSVEVINVPGRNGDLIIDNGRYENITATYTVAVMGDVPKNTNRLKYLLYSQKGYQRLYDSDRKGFYRKAVFHDGFDITGIDNGKCRVVFDCKPLLYDINGDVGVSITTDGSITNPYYESSRPMIAVNGTGSGTVSIGSQTISISDIGDGIIIDCEAQEVYNSSMMNKNSVVNTADIVLLPGVNSVAFSGGVTSITITPRWVTL